MKDDSVVFSYLASAAAKLVNEMASKHEGEEFLPDITLKSPHLHHLKHKLLKSYCELVIEIQEIYGDYRLCKKTAKSRFKKWLQNLETSRKLENKLYFESSHVDIGGDH